MKYPNLLLSILLVFLMFPAAHGQVLSAEPLSSGPDKPDIYLKSRHCAPQAALLRVEVEQGLSTSRLAEKYPLAFYDGDYFVPALLKISDDFNPGLFAMHQVQVNTAVAGILSVHIPLRHYGAFLASPGIEYLQLAQKVYPKLEEALQDSEVDLVHRGQDLSQSYSGRDVVVGIIDFGFDYTHPTFYNPQTGEYRIKRAWEQNTLFGDPPAGFSYGRELNTQQDLLAADTDIDLTGHGTHVAGVAVGSGGALSDRYRGVAYDSDIVLVSLNVRQGVLGMDAGVIDGINYIFQYAESVGKPAVVNISQGHHTGPHDGTSLTDQAIDALSGPGRIVVGAVGNEGDASGFYLHFDHRFDEENDILSYLVWPDQISAGATLVDIWGEEGADFQVGLEIFNPKTKQREAESMTFHSEDPISFASGTLVDNEGDTLYYEGAIEINPLNNRPHAQLYIDNSGQAAADDVDFSDLLDNDFVQLRFQATQGTVHAYAANNSGEAFFTDLSGIGAEEFIDGVRVLGGNPWSTMGELGGTANDIISVGGYTTRNTFTNSSGVQLGSGEVIGEAYYRSSRGPTLDGRVKPDISAPADLIATAESSFYTDYDPAVEVDQIEGESGGSWSFTIQRGTSLAAPLVAGIAAMMLEADPELTPETIKSMLTDYAEQDAFTGILPNQVWGFGKVNAHRVLSGLEQATSTSQLADAGAWTVFPNPSHGAFVLDSETRGPVQIEIFDRMGRSVFFGEFIKTGPTLNLQLPEPGAGMYFLYGKEERGTFQRKLILLD